MDHQLYENLEKLTLTGSYGVGNGLKSILARTNETAVSTRKSDILDALMVFYEKPDAAGYLYRQLNDYEKELLTVYVQSNYHPLYEDLSSLAKKYDHPWRSSWSSKPSNQYFPKDSPLFALLPNDHAPQAFVPYFDQVVPKYKRHFETCQINVNTFESQIVGRQSRYQDFDRLLAFVNSQSVAATSKQRLPAKAPLVKFWLDAGYEEIFLDGKGMNFIRNAGETTVSAGLFQLLRCGDVISIQGDKFKPSRKAKLFAGFSPKEKAKFLYQAYLKNGSNSLIDEPKRVLQPKLKFSRSRYNLTDDRQMIVNVLKDCPVGEWVKFSDFSKEIRKAAPHLFGVVGDALVYSEKHRVYFRGGWEEFEQIALSVILTEYLAVLGVLDVVVVPEERGDYGMESSFEARYFRVTELGAYLLGTAIDYEEIPQSLEMATDNGVIILPNFEIKIPLGVNRFNHEMFFDRFAHRISSDDQQTFFQLDFSGIVKALELGISIKHISAYCLENAKEAVPEAFIEKLVEWEQKSGRIRIRRVTLIEADDPTLLDEIMNFPGIKGVSEKKEVTKQIILASGQEKKAKKAIEKKEFFCEMQC